MANMTFFRRALILLIALVAVNATQVMQRPDNYKDAPHKFQTEIPPKPTIIHKRANAKVSAAYFTNWGIYGANFQPTSIVTDILTHILYAFADIDPSTGTVKLTDSYADEQKHFPGDSWSEPGNNLYGCLKQLYLIKLANRNIKTLLSVGGWTYSQDSHFSFVTDASLRATFVSTATQIVEDYGFDGLDLDFEYPANSDQGTGFANLITELRASFDALATKKGDKTPYEITAAVSAGPANYANLVVPQMNTALTYWNLMAYDYAGSWLNYTDNQANVYGGVRTGVSTDAAIKYFTGAGATASKINMGIPLYGHAFEETTGLGAPYTGIGPGTIQAGIYSYNTLPLAGASIFENTTDITSYSYDSAKQEFVSYDTPDIVKLKAQYMETKGLAGAMFWDLSTDKVGADSLVGTAAGVFGSLDQTQNHISYPDSKWDNIKNNMAGSSSSTTTSASTTTTPPSSTSKTSTSTAPTTSTSSGSGTCSGVAAWNSGSVYTVGMTATYGGHLWTAKWWTENDIPGGAAGAWTDNGAC